MFGLGWIKRLGRKPQTETQMAWDYEVPTPEQRRASRIAELREQITTAKRQKKKHSHLAATLARLEQADRPSNHMIQEPGQ